MGLWTNSFQNVGASLALLLSAQASTGETVTGQEFFKDRSGYPCLVTMNTDTAAKVSLQLSDYKDVWSINFFLMGREQVYIRYFDSQGIHDSDAFRAAFGNVKIGKQSFDFQDVSLFAVQSKEVDEKTEGIFEIKERHNAVQALEAMANDGIVIPGLISLGGTAAALTEFRSCSYEAMGLSEGEHVETDYRAEFRMIFERAFEAWVSSLAKRDQCLGSRFDEAAVEEVVNAAADAFYPGILNFRKRSSYRADLERTVPLAKLSGIVDAQKGCLMTERLAEISRLPVDHAIKKAEDLN